MNTYRFLLTQKQDGILLLTLNRPSEMNALDSGVLGELEAFLQEVSHDDEVQVVIVTGSGKAFVAGADIAQMAAGVARRLSV